MSKWLELASVAIRQGGFIWFRNDLALFLFCMRTPCWSHSKCVSPIRNCPDMPWKNDKSVQIVKFFPDVFKWYASDPFIGIWISWVRWKSAIKINTLVFESIGYHAFCKNRVLETWFHAITTQDVLSKVTVRYLTRIWVCFFHETFPTHPRNRNSDHPITRNFDFRLHPWSCATCICHGVFCQVNKNHRGSGVSPRAWHMSKTSSFACLCCAASSRVSHVLSLLSRYE